MPIFLMPLSRQLVLSVLLGISAVAGFAPFYGYPVTIFALAGWFWLVHRATAPKQAFYLGLAFGIGLFGTGISWLYISLHDFGGMHGALSALAVAGVCLFVSLFPAATGWFACRWFGSHKLLALPLFWALLEWVRSWLFTGFPWLTFGYSQVPYSPLAGLAPVFGVLGVSLAAASCAALMAAWLAKSISRKTLALSLLAFWLSGSALKHIEWSQPYGKQLSFSLLQGNIRQDLKWRPEELENTLQTYYQMVTESHAELIVMPEMALPQLPENLPTSYLASLARYAKTQGSNVLVGIPEAAQQDGKTRYYNSMVSLGAAHSQIYRKTHLVPFGEFIPFKSLIGWIYQDLLHIPLADQEPGGLQQQPMQLGGQNIALNICYEDVFGEEIIRQLPRATLLVNVSNDAWYGDAWFGLSLAAHQHMQMSQTRALETARAMLRSTNTGATAVIGRDGRVLAQLPHFTRAALEGQVQGYTGITPYVWWGNWAVIVLIVTWLGWLRRNANPPPPT